MSNIIFLDIDGVLNNEETKEKIGHICGIDDSLLIKLKELVTLFNADIVLSSSWRLFWNRDLINDGINNWRGRSKKRYGRYLNIKFAKYGLQITDKTEDIYWAYRAMEIAKYLTEHPEIENFIILDDEQFAWHKYGLEKHWINTDDSPEYQYHYRDTGLKDEHIEYVKNNLHKFTRKKYKFEEAKELN